MSDTNTGSAPAAPTGPLSEAAAADIFASILSDAPPKKADTPKDEPEEAPQATEEAAEADEPEADDAEGEEPDAPQSDDEDANAAPEEKPQTIRLDDGTEVTLDELRRGYLRQSDYTRKTQEAAELRKAADAKLSQLTQAESTLQAQLQQAAAIMQRNMPRPPDPDLREIDPVGYLIQKETYDKAVAELNGLASQWHASQQRVQAAQVEQAQKIKEAEFKTLLDKFPELQSPEKRKAFKDRLYGFATKHLGFTESDLDRAIDHRAFTTLELARIGYEYLNQKKPVATQKAKEAPPVAKPGQRATPEQRSRTVIKEQMARLRQTGSEADAASIFSKLI